MTSFRDVQNLCLLSHGLNFIDHMEFPILYDFPYEFYTEFHLDEMAESECRFKKRDVYRVADILQIPQTIR